jgi:outer membrane protein OmpA-like peptidoglycan-associated protein
LTNFGLLKIGQLRNKIALLFLLFTVFQSFAQPEYSRFSVSPYFGLGMRFPAKQQVLSGSEQMIYLWKFYNFGNTFNANGESQINLNSTNRIGLNLDYRLLDKLDIFGRVERINSITAYQSSLTYDFRGSPLGGFFDNFNYYSFGSGFRFRTYNLFFTGAVNFQPNIFGPRNRRASRDEQMADPGSFVNSSGTGLTFSSSVSQRQRLSFYLSLGQEIDFMNGPAFLEIGVNLSPTILYTQNIDFYSGGSGIGKVKLDHSTNAVFVTLSQPLYFKKRNRKLKNEPRESIEPAQTEKFEFGRQNISIGDNLVLEHIQFQQSKAILSLEAMGDLDEVFDLLVKYPGTRIQLSGHTSQEGSRRQNIDLSEKRAEACKDYLVRKGIDRKRIRTVGYGPDKPVSEDNQELNRRVELQILSVDK